MSIFFNSFEYDLSGNTSTLSGRLTILLKPDVIPDISVKNPPDCIILDKWVFENFILADETFAKTLWILKLVYHNAQKMTFSN